MVNQDNFKWLEKVVSLLNVDSLLFQAAYFIVFSVNQRSRALDSLKSNEINTSPFLFAFGGFFAISGQPTTVQWTCALQLLKSGLINVVYKTIGETNKVGPITIMPTALWFSFPFLYSLYLPEISAVPTFWQNIRYGVIFRRVCVHRQLTDAPPAGRRVRIFFKVCHPEPR